MAKKEIKKSQRKDAEKTRLAKRVDPSKSYASLAREALYGDSKRGRGVDNSVELQVPQAPKYIVEIDLSPEDTANLAMLRQRLGPMEKELRMWKDVTTQTTIYANAVYPGAKEYTPVQEADVEGFVRGYALGRWGLNDNETEVQTVNLKSFERGYALGMRKEAIGQ